MIPNPMKTDLTIWELRAEGYAVVIFYPVELKSVPKNERPIKPKEMETYLRRAGKALLKGTTI
jgi:hypothetical protein